MAWNDLSIAQRSQLINTFRHNGVSSLSEMKRLYDLYSPLEGNVDTYNTSTAPMYAEGGQIPGGKTIEAFERALPHKFDALKSANRYAGGGNLFWPGGNIVNAVKNAARKVINPEARLAESYSSKKYTFDEAYKDARSKGQRTFFWNGNYYNTDYEGQHGRQYAQDVLSGKAAAFEAAYPGFTNPELRKEKQEELDTYGITNEQTQNKNIVSKRLLDNIDPYGNYDLAQAIDAVVLNHKQRKTDLISQANNETHIAQLRNYLGYPAEPTKFTTPEGAPVKISKYTPTVGNSQEGKYYYTFKRNPFGYQPQNPERYLSEYERLKSVGDKYLSGQFYEDARKHGLDYATKIADENTQAWSDYYDNHRDEIEGYGPLELAFKITQETGSKEQRRSYGNAGGLGHFAVYNNPTYSSFYDLWDIGIGQGNNTNTFGVGKPFEYYDRRYHNPAEEPDIDKLYAEFSTGGKIHIKKKNRGKFTALKERTGHFEGDNNNGPKFKKSQEAYYDKDTDTIYAPDSIGEFYHHEMFHARPDSIELERLKPYYENLDDNRLLELGADLPFIKRMGNDPGHFYSPEEVGARVSAAKYMLSNAGINKIDNAFLEEARKNENAYGDNFRDLLHMYNDENLIGIFNNSYSLGGKIYIKPSHRGRFTELKERTGHSASWFKAHGTPAQRKMATFELNSRHWKHSHGGIKF